MGNNNYIKGSFAHSGGMARRLSACLAGLALVFSLASPAALAAGEQVVHPGGSVENAVDGVVISKTIAETGQENLFDITLKVGTSSRLEEIYQEPDMAVVLVMDVSNTMTAALNGDYSKFDAAIAAADSFVDEFRAGNRGASRIGFVAFNTNSYEISPMQALYTDAQAEAFKADYLHDTAAIMTKPGYDSSDERYTNIEAGLKRAGDMLSGTDNAHKYIILLSDGLPTTYLSSGYTGYRPMSSSGSPTPDEDGTFYDRINGKYIRWGTNYSDKAAQRAAAMAGDIKAGGTLIFSVGVGIDTFTAVHKDENDRSVKVYLNSTAYINDQLDRAAGTGAYAGRSNAGVATIDNYVTSRSQLAVGDVSNGSVDVFKLWLRDSIGSGYYYNSANSDELIQAYREVFQELTRLNRESSARVWRVEDPLPDNGMMEFIGFPEGGGFTSELEENAAVFDAENGSIIWDLKQAPCTSREEGRVTWYSYELKYRLRLKNETSGFDEEQPYAANGRSFLEYQTLSNINGNVSVSGIKTMDFPVPSVKGWLGELSFKKLAGEGGALEGAEFTLSHDGAKCTDCRGDGRSAVNIVEVRAASDREGMVSFASIPSGHSYTLTENRVPEGYAAGDREYSLELRYDELGITVTNSAGEVTEWTGEIVNEAEWPTLPQTGQLWWPVPVLLALGLSFVVFAGGRRRGSRG